jgi:hypothetical protein
MQTFRAGEIVKAFSMLVASCAALSIGAEAASGAVLYDVSFSAPLHTAGLLPAIGGTQAPTSLIAQPTVQTSFGTTASQSLEIWPPTNVDRRNATEGIVFGITTIAPQYLIECDLWIESLPYDTSEGFSILARMDNSPFNVNSFDFRGGQNLGFFSQDSHHAFGGLSQGGGKWPLMQVMHLTANIDLAHAFWTVQLDGIQVHANEFAENPGAHLTSIEFSVLDTIGNGDSAARIDNIVISAVPEPSTAMLVAIGSVALWAFFSRKAELPK